MIMLFRFWFFLLLVSPVISRSQNFHQVQSFPLLRMATYQPVIQGGVFYSSNPATLSGMKNFSVVIASERRFMLEELTQYSIQAGLPLEFLALGLKLDKSGNELMSETQAGLLFSKKLSKAFFLGFEINYYVRAFEQIQKQTAISAGIGMIFHLSEQLVTGVHIYNPTRVQVKKTGE